MNDQQGADVLELGDRIRGIRFAMVTLPDVDGSLCGRPLTVQDLDFDGTLWFLVSRSAEWTSGVRKGTSANVAFSDAADQRWVSIAGTVELVDDRGRIESMWNPMYDSWFEGVADPDVTLLRFDAAMADYWDAENNKIVRLSRLA